MERCLKKQLSANVEGNLPIYNKVRLQVTEDDSPSESKQELTLYMTVPFTISVTEGGGFADTYAGLSNPKTREDYQAGTVTIYVKNGTYQIHISSKYDIAVISTNANSLINANLAEISFIDFSSLELRGINNSGNMSELKNCINLSSLALNGTRVLGTAKDLGALTSLSYCTLGTTSIEGDIKDLVNKQVENGRAICAFGGIRFVDLLPKVTFNGVTLNDSRFCNLGWESSTKIVLGIGSGSFADVGILYVIGYSDTEIETNTSSGGVWEGKEVARLD